MQGGVLRAYRCMAVLGVLFILWGASAGCGRKMPPIAPGTYPPPVVKNLTFELKDDQLTLFWSAPAVRSEKESPAVGFRILRARLTASETECRSCRVRYETAGEVRLADKDPSGRLQFQERLAPGYNFRYKIISFSADGLDSKDSVIVHPTD